MAWLVCRHKQRLRLIDNGARALFKFFGIPRMDENALQVACHPWRQSFPRMLGGNIIPDNEVTLSPSMPKQIFFIILPSRDLLEKLSTFCIAPAKNVT